MADAKLCEMFANVDLIHDDLNRFISNTKKRGLNKYTVDYLKRRMATEKYESARHYHAKIVIQANDEQVRTLTYFKNLVYDSVMKKFEEIELYLDERIDELISTGPNVTQTIPGSGTAHVKHVAHVKLPDINLPTFSGKYSEWTTFKDQFESLIDKRTDIPSVRKFQYLKSCLAGEASRVIDSYNLTAENYESAWKSLIETYSNDRVIISELFSSIYDIRQVSFNNLTELKYMKNTVRVGINSLKNLEIDLLSSEGSFFVYSLVRKFDHEMRMKWESRLSGSKKFPSFTDVEKFISERINALEAIKPRESNRHPRKETTVQSHVTFTPKFECVACSQSGHFLNNCQKFKSLNPRERYAIIKEHKLCANCFRPNHASTNCNSQFRCQICKKPHHTLLHFENQKQTLHANSKKSKKSNSSSKGSPTDVASDSSDSDSNQMILQAHACETSSVSNLLATAYVKVRGPNGRIMLINALLDPASNGSFVSARTVKNLKLNKMRADVSINGIGEAEQQPANAVADFSFVSRFDASSKIDMTAVVLNKITSYKVQKFDVKNFPQWKNLPLAMGSDRLQSDIDVLIGVDYLPRVLTGVTLISDDKNLMAQSTIFGYVVSGSVSPSRNYYNDVTFSHCSNLDQTLRRFWELEEIPSESKLSVEDEQCEKLFAITTYQIPSGRFVVRLPFKNSDAHKSLGSTRIIAETAVNRIERRLQRNDALRIEYENFLNEYESLGHMSELSLDQAMRRHRIFIPHHPVFKITEGKPKLRVVFNGATPTSSGVSLNQTLSAGPKLQTDIASILLRWREPQFVFTADVVKMFRQILVHEDDRIFQNIVWKDFETEKFKYFELNTVTYGLVSSPFLSIRVIREIANKCKSQFPRIAKILETNSYVDDIFAGANELDELENMKRDLLKVLESAELELSKWRSNTQAILNLETDSKSFDEGDSVTSKILGILWQPNTDEFNMAHDFEKTPVYTKRAILSLIARIFDPLGWVSPITIKFKQFIQKLWLAKLDWDDKLPDALIREWEAMYSPLSLLNQLKIPRWYGPTENSRVELIGYSDASSLSFSAVIYLRVINSNGEISTTNLMAKTRVAPVKTLSIPRLELSAAALLANLIVYYLNSTTLKITSVTCFSDSKITLAWLAKHPSNWNVFVTNKVSLIQTQLPTARWGYVKSKENPADLNSRGITVPELIDSNLWWHRPPALKTNHNLEVQNEFVTTVDQRKKAILTHVVTETPKPEPFDRWSSYSKIVRIYAYVFRFANSARKLLPKSQTTALTGAEISQARLSIVKKIQQHAYSKELKALLAHNIGGGPGLTNSNLLPITPFLDAQGVLRVGGRIENSTFPYEQQHPIIIPPGNFAKKLIRHFHLENLHLGLKDTLNLMRLEFWLINARNQTKKVIHGCTICRRERQNLASQLMGSLPKARCTLTRAFEHTGIDYAGPFLIKDREGRGSRSHKSYIAVFICLATRAIHLELVTHLDTPSFLAALQRFISRRGKPTKIHSDSGRNFVGASRELDLAFEIATHNDKLQTNLAEQRIKWQFIPPAAPHMGGSWERAVRSVKYHLKREMGSFLPTWEEMLTILTRIEACLNSRPLCKLKDDPQDLGALTPAHFLVHGPLLGPPEKSVLDKNENYLSRWQRIQSIVERVWKRWSTEFLTTLQTRPKWREIQRAMKPDDIVLIRDPNNPPCKWTIARVIKIHLGANNLPRVVDLKTSFGSFTRPVTQLCPLVDVDAL